MPVLIHAFPDDPRTMTIADRRDSFCGKMSAANNLRQYGIPFSLTTLHTMDPNSDAFTSDLRAFAGVCRVTRGLRQARVGALGARPAAFNTVRYSEKLLEQAGISVETLDLSEALGRIDRLEDEASPVTDKLASIRRYANTTDIPDAALLKMAKFGVVLDGWMRDAQLDATAVQCWTAMEEFFGVVPCTLMSMASNGLIPSACETDVVGVVAMLALQLASVVPARWSIGTITTVTIRTRPSSFTAPTCLRTFSSRRSHGWIIRRSSPVPSGARTRMGPSMDACARTRLPIYASAPTT